MNNNPFVNASIRKKKTPLIISLVGESASGKTYSSLRLARGLTSNPSEIFLIDTENRGAMYADEFGDYQVANVHEYALSKGRPTHRPQNYSELIDIAKKNGAKVIIIDSLSDVWAGEGGCVSWATQLKEEYEKKQAEKGFKGKQAGISVWAMPKTAYNELMNKICNSDVSIIFTFKTKEITDVQKDSNGKMVVKEDKKVEIIREQGNKYNILWEVHLNGATKKVEKIGKTFDGGDWIFKVGEYLSEETAKNMLDWQNTNKNSVIKAGVEAKDKTAWFNSLNKAEKYLAHKYAEDINRQTKTTLSEEDL